LPEASLKEPHPDAIDETNNQWLAMRDSVTYTAITFNHKKDSTPTMRERPNQIRHCQWP
jgi:hypothetical protein